MKRILPLLLLATIILPATAADDMLYLTGRVKESIGKTDLTSAKILLYDSTGTVKDTIQANQGLRSVDGEPVKMSYFGFQIPRCDSTYVFDVVCDGYTTQTITFPVENVGKRETGRMIPIIFMQRAPRQLGEVTVTASKIKFYNKGDTVVFNADAFQLAEGSMLDALIAQLPGVELNDNGQIKVNGEFVESLLLDGREFLDGNNQLMFENIAAYTVKNIEIYEGQTDKEKWLDDPFGGKHLTMNVKLKKEYNIGLGLNVQGGYGTSDRYMGRLFASYFNPTTRVTLLGNVNNLNDTRKPGKIDSWTPDMMPSGTREYRMASMHYDYENPEETRMLNGHVTFEQTISNNQRTTRRTNFLPGGYTYDNSVDNSYERITRLETRHSGWLSSERMSLGGYVQAKYRKVDTNSSAASATFDSEQQDMTMSAIEAIYSAGTPAQLDAIINRSITKSNGSSRQLDMRICPYYIWRIPGTSDRLSIDLYARYDDTKEELWRDYIINFGNNPQPAERRRQYFDNSPNRLFTTVNNITYYARFNTWDLSFNYEYRFTNRDKDSYMYALDRLADMGIYGTLPSGYLASFDPANSYTSRTLENKHSIQLGFNKYLLFPDRSYIMMSLAPNFSLKHIHFDYWRDGRSQIVKSTDFLVQTSQYTAEIRTAFKPSGEGRNTTFAHQLRYSLDLKPSTPEPIDMVEAVNDSDPLNIVEGNPGLKTQYEQTHRLKWRFSPSMPAHKITNDVELKYAMTTDALTKGYIYDTSTGVRHIKTYNVNGNSSLGLLNTFRLQFGSSEQFTLSSITDASTGRYADMIGTDVTEPAVSRVRTNVIGEKADLSWQIGQQNLTLRGSVTNRHSYSSREDFNSINACHYSFGIIGQFKLPAGFGISTDFTLYSRRGYGTPELDTTDAIWNMRLTFSPVRNKHWVFMLDGFDMLHQLSNVNYAVNAAGRTVTYTNALPRYIMLSAQYRFNIQPKK